MTFIASVVAKKGVAVIADSLITTTKPILTYQEFNDYLSGKGDGNDVKIEPKEISNLFKWQPSHTKDYEEKLFQYDNYTAITTSGQAVINDKKIGQIVNEAEKKFNPYQSDKSFQEKLEEFQNFIIEQIKEHLQKYPYIAGTTFIVSHYSVTEERAIISKISVQLSSQKNLAEDGYSFIKVEPLPDHLALICDGQNKISEGILYHPLGILDLIPRIVEKISKDFLVDIPQEYIVNQLQQIQNILTPQEIQGIKILQLTGLSLQQAVNLATLLMRLELDFQKYTEDIPTVGGVIKLAVIGEKGFQWVTGNDIVLRETF